MRWLYLLADRTPVTVLDAALEGTDTHLCILLFGLVAIDKQSRWS